MCCMILESPRFYLQALLLKFAEWFDVDRTVHVTCMTALHSNAGDLIRTSVLHNDKSDILESLFSSPFSMCLAESTRVGKRLSLFGHLQRRSLLLFFRVVATDSRKTGWQATEATTASKLSQAEDAFQRQLSVDFVCWLKNQLQADGNRSTGMESSFLVNHFCLSLLQLFAEEVSSTGCTNSVLPPCTF